MSNQKRRLEERGGRREVNHKFTEQVGFYGTLNRATGSKSIESTEGGEKKEKLRVYKRLVPAGRGV